MRYTIRIKRQENKEAKPFWQVIEKETADEQSIAAILKKLNTRQKLTYVLSRLEKTLQQLSM